MKKPLSEYNDADHIEINAKMIEASLASFGILAKVAEINIEEKFYEYYLDLPMGTDLKVLEKHGKDLAMVLASPTGRVYWQIPVPGKSCIKLKVPKPSKAYLESIRAKHEALRRQNNLRSKIAFLFYLMGRVNYYIAKIIIGKG